MRRTLYICALCLTAMFIYSCGDDDDTQSDGQSAKSAKSGTIDSEAEKEFLEATAKEFLQNYNTASSFKNFTYMQEALDDTDTDEIEDWAEDIVDELKEFITSYDEPSGYTYYGYYGRKYNKYNVIYSASNFNGQFTLVNRVWKKTGNSKGVSFTFTDSHGQQCVASVSTSGTETKVAIGSAEDYLGYQNGWEKYDINNNYILVPQYTKVTVTQGGNSVLDMTLNIDIQNAGSDGIVDFNSTSFSLTSSILVNGIYRFQIDKTTYVPNATVEGVYRLIKNGNTLLTVSATGNGRLHEDTSDKDKDDLYGEVKLSEVNQVTVNVDVLGKVQVQAGVKDGTKFYDFVQAAEDNDDDETTFKRNISNANSLLTGYLYNNNDLQNRVAYVSLEAFSRSSYYRNWRYRPIMTFADGTSYTFDEYFDEISFKSVTNLAEDILEDFENLFDD